MTDLSHISCISFIDRWILSYCATWKVLILVCMHAKLLQLCPTLHESHVSYVSYIGTDLQQISVQFSSVTQLCLTLCHHLDCNTPGLPVHHQLLEFTLHSFPLRQ